MADDRYAERAARVLIAARGRIEPRPDPDPQASIAALEVAIVSVVRRRRRRRIAVVSVVGVAAAALLPILVRAPATPVATSPASPSTHWAMVVEGRGAGRLLGAGDAGPVLPGDRLAAGAVVETGETELTMLSSDGTRLQVAAHSELRFTRADVIRWFRLARGAVSLAVAKLPPGQRFVVETPDRQVEVKGTRFAVHLTSDDGCAARTITRVAVEEGTVVVRENGGPDEVIRAGAHWPAGCSVVGAPVSTQAAPRHARPPTPPRQASRSGQSAEPPASTLAEENDLFSRAAHAARAGDRAAALSTLDELIRRYPSSPLRAAALEERLKIAGDLKDP